MWDDHVHFVDTTVVTCPTQREFLEAFFQRNISDSRKQIKAKILTFFLQIKVQIL
jgi:hypothetical protein